jgi:glucokinase
MQLKKFSIGIDIGGTNTTIGIVQQDGHINYRHGINTGAYDDAYGFMAALAAIINPIVSHYGIESFSGIGMGAPNANFHRGTIEHAANLKWNGIIPIAQYLGDITGLPCYITNDAKATAIGEMTFGAAKGCKDFIVITLGTGVGSGFVSNGQLIYGYDGMAGELGHTIVKENGRSCGCGRMGCLETYTSATGIVRTALHYIESDALKYSNSILVALHKEKTLSAKDIYTAALDKDALALEIFDYTGKILGTALANAVAITSPEKIILFGGLSKAGSYILEPTQQYMEQNLLYNYKNKIQLLCSTLPENDTAILGAAALAWHYHS